MTTGCCTRLDLLETTINLGMNITCSIRSKAALMSAFSGKHCKWRTLVRGGTELLVTMIFKASLPSSPAGRKTKRGVWRWLSCCSDNWRSHNKTQVEKPLCCAEHPFLFLFFYPFLIVSSLFMFVLSALVVCGGSVLLIYDFYCNFTQIWSFWFVKCTSNFSTFKKIPFFKCTLPVYYYSVLSLWFYYIPT